MRKLRRAKTTELLESIATKGLIPSSSIKVSEGTAGSMPVLGEGSLCVNYVNLDGASKDELTEAFDLLTLEEYTGIAGIALERRWPLSKTKFSDELNERLSSVAVFILDAPERRVKSTKVYGSDGTEIEIGQYGAGAGAGAAEGFSQLRGDLLTSKKAAHSKRVVEIKTRHHFKCEAIKAILVPMDLFAVAESIFAPLGARVLSVPLEEIHLQSIGYMVEAYHGEMLEPGSVAVGEFPIFARAIRHLVTEEGLKHFSVHATRLPTSYDLTVRIVADIKKSAELIRQAHGVILEAHADGSAWVGFSKTDAHSLTALAPLMLRVANEKFENPLDRKSIRPDPKRLEETRHYLGGHEALVQQIIATKADLKMKIISLTLSGKQIAAIKKARIHLFKTDETSYMAAHLPAQQETLTQIVYHWGRYKTELQATKIQAAYRGFRAKNLYRECQKTKARCSALKAELSVAEVAHAAAATKLLGLKP